MNINKPPVLWFANLEPYSISLPKFRKVLSIEHCKTELSCDTIVNNKVQDELSLLKQFSIFTGT